MVQVALGTSRLGGLLMGLDFEAFEEILGTRYSGSNSLYVKLSGGKRKRVFTFYLRDNRISSVREKIVRLQSSG